MKLQVTNGWTTLSSNNPKVKNEEQKTLLLPSKKSIVLGNTEKADIRLHDPRLPPNTQLVLQEKEKETTFKTNIEPVDILRAYPNSVTLKPGASCELQKGDLIEVFHQAYIFKVL